MSAKRKHDAVTETILKLSSAASTLKLAVFSEDGISHIKLNKFNRYALLLLAAFIQGIPSTPADVFTYLGYLAMNTAIIAVLITISIAAMYLVSRWLGSSVRFGDYLKNMALTIFILTLLSIVTAFILINFGILIGHPDVAFKLVQGSIITYYVFVVFGWCAERLAGFDDLRGVAVGVLSIALYYGMHIVISLLP